MDKQQNEPSRPEEGFRHPPLWIHVSAAGKWLLRSREAKKRAVIRILDRVKTRGPTPPAKI
jgi:hypothetical protein